MSREKRKVLAQETLDIINNKNYRLANDVLVNIKDELIYSRDSTKVYSPEELDSINLKNELKKSYKTTFEVVNEDVVSCIHRVIKEEKEDVMCLNFASAKNAGGGFLNGAIAQEESLAFSSNLYDCQINTKGYYDTHKKMKSCIYSDTMIYSPKVVFFRNNVGVLEEKPSLCNVITSAAVNKGVVINREDFTENNIKEVMLKRIDHLLSLSYLHNNKVLILGAWGCGVFKNEPQDIALLFAQLLNSKYKGVFKKVVFAIFSKNDKFIQAFEREFLNY